MIETVTTIEVDRPAADVFAFVADMENNPDWQTGMKSCKWTTDPPIGVGSRYDQLASFMGKIITSRFEVAEYVPGECIRIVTYESTFPLDIVRKVDPLGVDRCRVTAIVSGEQAGVFKIFGPLLSKMVAASVRKDYARLQDLLHGS